ncbi:MAG: EndoU domain-containing protein [Comamonadaceae bacterium]|uniref:EndoU domain-containing protein n=1 Tax=Hydrogenophaga sp. SNF1 TaxID=3098762 RepID=UPI003A0FD0CC|nr:EndoU domain-containing protein [Comamonadaceae bacterium]
MPGKTPFPQDWDADKVLGNVSDVANDPNSATAPARGGRTIVRGTREGVDIEVILESASRGGRIVTGYPTNLPRNPK